MRNIKKIILVSIILISISYIFIISYKINIFLSSKSKISEEVILELSKKGISKEEINKLPNILINYIAKDNSLKSLTKSHVNKIGSLVFSTQGDSTVNIQNTKISFNYLIKDNIKFNPFSKDTILIIMDSKESYKSENFLFVEGIDYLGKTKIYNKVPIDHFLEQKYEGGEVFVVPNLIVYKRFIICNHFCKEMIGYLSK